MTIQERSLLGNYERELRELRTATDGWPDVAVLEGDSFYARYGKPVMDRTAAALLLVLVSPILLFTALSVLIKLNRPILLKQRRIGRGGQPFSMLKFRTMRPDRRQHRDDWDAAERRFTHKSPNDPRHTPLGRVLRKLSLDELPQLFNVLKGEMSLVGPRPELAEVVEMYQPWQHDRHSVRPGLTGLWQTTARGVGLMNDYVHLDLHYIEHLSFKNDMRLLFRTINALARPSTH